VVTNGPKLWKIFCCSSYQMQGFLLVVYYYRRQICNEIFIHYLHLQTIDLHVYLRTEAIFKYNLNLFSVELTENIAGKMKPKVQVKIEFGDF
jgi:uncharacterized membrane protein